MLRIFTRMSSSSCLSFQALVHRPALWVRTVGALLAAAALTTLPLTSAVAQTTSDQPQTTLQQDDVNCGTDLSCFADLAPDCTASAVSYTLTVDLAPLIGLQSGFASSTTDALRMQPDPDGSQACQFSIKVQRVDNRLLPEAVQALTLRGVSQASIDQTQQSMAASGKSLEGRGGTCLFAPDDLSTMLQQWQQGHFSTDDFAAGTCQGSYFGD